jgi:hypothetical protein
MAKLTPQQIADKWAQRLSGATADIKAGVMATKTAPSASAIAKKDKFRQNLLRAIDNGDWEAGLSKVTLGDWQQAMLNKGLGRIASGAQASQSDFANFMGELLPFQEQLTTQIKAMPDLTLEDNINRMATMVRGMSTFKRSKR